MSNPISEHPLKLVEPPVISIPPEHMLATVVGQVAAAYVSHHSVSLNDLATVIHTIQQALTHADKHLPKSPLSADKPAVDINNSIHADYLICLEDGRPMKMLKRYLRTTYGITPEQYRERWNLPMDYPMVAPNYASKRSNLAKLNGLGHNRRS